jgi:hypothetical protein
MLRGKPSVYDSMSYEENGEDIETTVALRIYSCILREESESFLELADGSTRLIEPMLRMK